MYSSGDLILSLFFSNIFTSVGNFSLKVIVLAKYRPLLGVALLLYILDFGITILWVCILWFVLLPLFYKLCSFTLTEQASIF